MSFNDIFKSSYLENITAVSIPDMAIALISRFVWGCSSTLSTAKRMRASCSRSPSAVR